MSSCNTPCVEASSIFIALIEGRGSAKGELGIASFDLKNPALVLYQFTDSQTYTSLITKLNLINPNEVIMANTVCEQETLSKLFKIVSDKCQLKVSSVSRKYFNDQKGFEYIKRLCSEDYATVEFQVKFKYYCLAASYALLKYLEFTQNAVFVPASLKVVFKGSDHTVSIDYSTAKNLELLKSLSTVPSAGTMKSGGASLYSCLNNTKTYMGARLLRSNILQPLCCECLRQMALLQIMAQMGSYVPAETASFRMSDHIFSRIGSDLDVGLGLSTFMAEMREVNYIIQNANDTSLVIIDELGKSTCEDEGVSICVAIIEFLLGTKAFCFFATHYRHIMMLEDVYARVENYHFSHLDEGSEDEQLAHSLVKGKIPEHHYGIQLAKISTLPKEIIFNAEVFCRRIEADPKA